MNAILSTDETVPVGPQLQDPQRAPPHAMRPASTLATSDPQFQVVAPADSMVPPGGNLTIELAFTPAAAAAITAELAISFDAAPAPQLTVMLTGTGTTTDTPGPPGGGDGGCSSQRGGHGGPSALAAAALGMLLRRHRRRS